MKFLQQRLSPLKRLVSRISYVLGPSSRKALLPILIGFLFLSSLDLIGLSLVGPFVALAADAGNLDAILGSGVLSGLTDGASPLKVIAGIGIAIVCVFIVKSFSGFYVNRAIMRFAMNHQKDTKARLLQAYLSLPLEQALGKNSATLLTTVNQHVLVFTNRVLVPVLKGGAELVFFSFLFVFLLVNNPWVTLLLGITVALIGIIYDVVVKKKIAAAGADSIYAVKETTKVISQSSDGFKEIRVAGAEKYFISGLERFSDVYADAAVYTQSLAVVPRYLIEATVVSLVVLFVVLGLYVHGGPSPELMSTVGIFAFAALRAMPSINALLSATNHLRYGGAVLVDLQRDLQEAATHQEAMQRAAKLDEYKGDGKITFDRELCAANISYSYPNKTAPAIESVSLCIAKGQSVGVIGSSGSGKTTLIDLLLGLLLPQQGQVTVDGKPVSDALRGWMDKIAYIPQSVFLLDDTIMANVAFGVQNEDIDKQRVHDSLALAQLTEMVARLPEKELTMVGERGTRLSGGQRQRVALARALYHERELLVMDEGTAALDSETEKEVVEAVKSLHGRVTMIVIAHRMTTLKYCDIVYAIEGGCLRRSGTYEEMLPEHH